MHAFEVGYHGNINNIKAKFLAILNKNGIKLDTTALLYIIGWDYCREIKFCEAEKAPGSQSILENEADKEALEFMKKN